MKIYWERIIALLISVALIIPIAPVLYALAGAGVGGGIACMVLGVVTILAVQTVVSAIAEGVRWRRDRKTPPEYMPLVPPTNTAYELDWTKINEGDKL